MHIDTYNAIMRYQDQFIACRDNTFGTEIVMLADDKESIGAVVEIARSAGLRVKKLIVGKGQPDAECHLSIR